MFAALFATSTGTGAGDSTGTGAASASAVGQACDRRVLVNVLDRYRRQVRPLPDPRAKLRHHHRVGTQIVEKIAVDRHPLGAYDISEHVGEHPLQRDWRGVGEGRGQACDRGVLVNVLDRHRRQVRPLPHPSAELRHHHRVGTKIIKEVAIDRHPLDMHELCKHLGEAALGARLGPGVPFWSDQRFSHTGYAGTNSLLHHDLGGPRSGRSAQRS